jgi:Flp pilus assembly pilin Flp
MTTQTKKLSRRNRGQGMTEYIIIVALIAIAAVGIITVFGNNIRALFGASVDILGGSTSATASLAGSGSHAGKRGLSDFGSE